MGRKYVIADTGNFFVTAEWEPDPEILAQRLLLMAKRLDDWQEPMTDAAFAFAEGVKRRFDTETDPFGVPWQQLNPDYASWKENNYPGQTILRLTDALFYAATDSGSYTVDAAGKDIWFDSSGLPFYAGYHQEGRLERTTKEGTPIPLPQRMFLGIDDEDALFIAAIFENWIETIVEETWVPYGIGERVQSSAGIAGRFSGVPAIGGGFLVRGFSSGHFIKGTAPGGSFRSRRRSR